MAGTLAPSMIGLSYSQNFSPDKLSIRIPSENAPYAFKKRWKEGITLFQCPMCGELLEALTNIHCKSRHYLTRRELIARHGAPKYIAPRVDRAVQRWIRDAQVITRTDFDMAQAAARNQLRKRATNY